jgi:hypothetical protein
MRTPGLPVPQALFGLCISLDLFVYFGVRIAPADVGDAVCAARPLSAIATPLFPAHWFDYVADGCAAFRIEPAISILAFMIKTSLTILALLVGSVQGVILGEPDLAAEFGNKYSFSEYIKGALGLAFCVAITVAAWLLMTSRAPEKFRTSLIDKIVLEDAGLILGLFLWSAVVVVTPLLLIRSVVSRTFHKKE